MSQQGTPFGAITLLNQARISGGTWSNCPLSTASAVPAGTERQASKANGASLRIRSSAFGCLAVAGISPAIRNPATIQAELACGCTLK
jgi:hypothetical protein